MQLDTLGVLKCVFFFFLLLLLLKPVLDQSMKALLNVNKVFPAAHPDSRKEMTTCSLKMSSALPISWLSN